MCCVSISAVLYQKGCSVVSRGGNICVPAVLQVSYEVVGGVVGVGGLAPWKTCKVLFVHMPVSRV